MSSFLERLEWESPKLLWGLIFRLAPVFTSLDQDSVIHYYAKEDNGYWLKFCHIGSEIDDKTLSVLTDWWFAKNSLIDLTVANQSNLMVETESFSTLKWKDKLKSELKEEVLIELGKESEIGNSTLERLSLFSKVLLGLTSLLLASQMLVILSK